MRRVQGAFQVVSSDEDPVGYQNLARKDSLYIPGRILRSLSPSTELFQSRTPEAGLTRIIFTSFRF